MYWKCIVKQNLFSKERLMFSCGLLKAVHELLYGQIIYLLA